MDAPEYLIRKGGAWYRPNSQGYTSSAIQAGRYTLADAENITHPNGPTGPRDGMFFVHLDDVVDDDWRAYRAATARTEALQADLEAVTTARDMMGRLWAQEKERAELLAAEREQLLSGGAIPSDQREKYDRLRANISVGKASQQDAVNAIAALCRDNERLALLCGDRKARAEAAEAAAKTARADALREAAIAARDSKGGAYLTAHNAILALIDKEPT